MATSDKEDQDALDALELEAKEFDKVRLETCFSRRGTQELIFTQDAEIDRILKAFRLDAYVASPLPVTFLFIIES